MGWSGRLAQSNFHHPRHSGGPNSMPGTGGQFKLAGGAARLGSDSPTCPGSPPPSLSPTGNRCTESSPPCLLTITVEKLCDTYSRCGQLIGMTVGALFPLFVLHFCLSLPKCKGNHRSPHCVGACSGRTLRLRQLREEPSREERRGSLERSPLERSANEGSSSMRLPSNVDRKLTLIKWMLIF